MVVAWLLFQGWYSLIKSSLVTKIEDLRENKQNGDVFHYQSNTIL